MKTKQLSERQLLGIAGLGWLFDAMDVGILSFIIAALHAEWGLSPTEMSWIGSVNSIGMAVGALVFGLLADRIGRKTVFIVTLVLFSVASGLSALTSTLVSETVAPEKRGKVVVLLESFWAFGWLLAALISYFVIPAYGWQLALILTAIPAFYAIYLRIKLPDSPQFVEATKEKKPSIADNVRSVWSKPYRQSTIMLWVLWFCVVFSYYGMFLWLPSVMVIKGFSLIKSFEYVLIMTLAQLPGYYTAAWFIERMGRKFVLVTYLLGTAASAYIFGNAESLWLLLTAGMLLSFFNLGAWGALYAYTPEQYPTSIRGTGAGMAASFGRIGGILGPLLVGYMSTQGTSLTVTFSIFCAAILIGVISVVFLGKETKQKQLA